MGNRKRKKGRKKGRKVNTLNKNFIKFSEWFSLMRAIDGVCSLQALWRQQLMLHVPGGGTVRGIGTVAVSRSVSLYPRHLLTGLLHSFIPL